MMVLIMQNAKTFVAQVWSGAIHKGGHSNFYDKFIELILFKAHFKLFDEHKPFTHKWWFETPITFAI